MGQSCMIYFIYLYQSTRKRKNLSGKHKIKPKGDR